MAQSQTLASRLVLPVVAVVALVAGGGIVMRVSGRDLPLVAAPAATASAVHPISKVQGTPIDLVGLVARVSPSVVTIRTSATNGRQLSAGIGTGVVVDAKGHIVTNNHVIDGAQSITVTFKDATVASASVVRTSTANDLALLLVSAPTSGLVPAEFANSDSVRAGEDAFAVGNPFGLDFTVTSGIVSGVHRQPTSGRNAGGLEGMIQTDAALNQGNSGGPLFDANGRVIGINTQIENPTGEVFAGVGLAIPSNVVQRFIAG